MSELVPLRPVWLASYPRSGNTFLRILFQNLFHLPTHSLYRIEGQEFPDPSAEALDEAPYLPRAWEEQVSSAADARLTLIKTHDPPRDEAPAIYLVRDGRAAVDSYYHYHQKFAFEKPSLTEVIAGACQFGSWSEHYRAWQPRLRPNTLFLRYEDLVTRTDDLVPRIAEFLQIAPAAGRLPAFSELQARFPAFFRRGRNEGFLREWSAGQAAMFDACHGEVMHELGYAAAGETQADATTVELARSANRLHRLYLEQLSRLGAAAASQQRLAEQVTKAGAELGRLCAELEDRQAALNHLSSRRWVRLGRNLGLVKTHQSGAGTRAGDASRSESSSGPVPSPGAIPT